MSINKTINRTKIYDGEDTAQVIGSNGDSLKVNDPNSQDILELILKELRVINAQLSIITNEELEEI